MTFKKPDDLDKGPNSTTHRMRGRVKGRGRNSPLINFHREALPGPAPLPKAKLTIAHKFMTTSGWDVGRVVKKCGALWAVKYPTDPQQYLHELNQQDYGHEGVWVAVKKGQG